MIDYIKGCIKNIGGKSSPLAMITTRSYVSKLARVGRYAKIYNSIVGDYSYVGPKSWLINTVLGKFCSVSSGCNIGLGNHTLNNVSTSPIFTEKINGTGSNWISEDVNKATVLPIKIGNDVWIGTNVIIQSGVIVGDGAVIGAGSIVTKDIPPYAIAVGVPAKIIRYRFDQETIELLLKSKWWDKSETELKELISIFQTPNPSLDQLKQLLNNVQE